MRATLTDGPGVDGDGGGASDRADLARWREPVAAVAAAATFGVVLYGASALPSLPVAALAAGVTLLAGTIAGFALVLSRPDDWSGSRLLASVALLLLAAAVAAQAGAAIPSDLHLFTLGRPPQLAWPVALAGGAIACGCVIALRGGASPRTAALVLLVPMLTLEGLPLATPAWLMLAAASIVLLLKRGERVAGASFDPPAATTLASIAVVAAFAAAATFGADPGTSEGVVVRVAALAIAGALIAGERKAGATMAALALLATAGAVALFALFTKILLARATQAIDVDVLGSELSLFSRHPNLLAPWFAAATLIAVSAAQATASPETRTLRIVARIALPFVVVALLLTASRLAIGATIAAGLASIALLARGSARPERRWRPSNRAMLAVIGGVAVLAVAVPAIPPLRAKVRALTSLSQSMDHRSIRMRVGLDTALDSPWLGQGPLCWFRQGAFTPASKFEGEPSADHPHCLPIAVFEGAGAIGLAAMLALVVAAAAAARRALRGGDPSMRPLALGVALALAMQLSTNLLDMGDALDTLVPSRLFLDAGVLAALAAAGVHEARHANSRIGSSIATAGTIVTVAAALALGVATASAERGRELSRQGLAARSLVEFETALAITPWATDVRLDLASTAFSAGNKRSLARDSLDRALRQAPLRPDLHEALGRARIAVDDPRGALESLRRAVDLDPHGELPRRVGAVLAELELDHGDRAKALAALAAAVRGDSSALSRFASADEGADRSRLRIGAHDVALDEVLAALEETSPDEPSEKLKARIALREVELGIGCGDFDRAGRALERYDLILPGSLSAQVFRARLLRAQGRLEEALAASESALARLDDPVLGADRGDILFAMGRVDDALAAYRASFSGSRDVFFHAYAYHHALERYAKALASKGLAAERATILETIAFFTARDLERAAVLMDVAADRRTLGDSAGEESALRRALILVLEAPGGEPSRTTARELGSRLAVAGQAREFRSDFADEFERLALARNAGPVTHEFRAALLAGLGLELRAKAATADLQYSR